MLYSCYIDVRCYGGRGGRGPGGDGGGRGGDGGGDGGLPRRRWRRWRCKHRWRRRWLWVGGQVALSSCFRGRGHCGRGPATARPRPGRGGRGGGGGDDDGRGGCCDGGRGGGGGGFAGGWVALPAPFAPLASRAPLAPQVSQAPLGRGYAPHLGTGVCEKNGHLSVEPHQREPRLPKFNVGGGLAFEWTASAKKTAILAAWSCPRSLQH